MQAALFDFNANRDPKRSWHQEMLTSLGVTHKPAWPDDFGRAIRRWAVDKGCDPITTLSLFSGGGGLDIAFHDCGFKILQMVEIEAKFVETLRKNSQKGQLLEGSQVIHRDIREYEPGTDVKVDFIIGGPPCQTFSAAGRRAAGVAGTSDPRGTLFEEYVRLLKQLNPKGFLFENVYGITGAQNGDAWRQIQHEFKSAGYSIHFRVLDAADYGVPQHRERLFIVGFREGEYRFPYPTHGPDSIGQQSFYTAREATADFDVSTEAADISGRFGALLRDIPPGLNYSFYTKEMGHPSPVFSWRSKFSDFLYKADPDAPVRTLKAQGGQYTGPFSWENRRFTIAELKRLQTFPDEYEIVGGQQVCAQQIGNSVPPQIGRILALSILNQLLGVELPFPMHYLPPNKRLSFRQRKRFLTAIYAEKARAAISQLRANGAGAKPQKPPRVENEMRFLSPNFAWESARSPDSIGIKLRHEFSDSAWAITAGLEESEDEPVKYEIFVSAMSEPDWGLSKSLVTLKATDWDERVLTALWKSFEEKVDELYGIADLVQLSGYYQYKPKVAAAMSFHGEATELWSVIRSVTQGIGVAQQLSANELSLLWGLHEKSLLCHLKSLRAIGYEVRNHNTNPQIPLGQYIVPYAFPTLTPKSVQLRKSLEKING